MFRAGEALQDSIGNGKLTQRKVEASIMKKTTFIPVVLFLMAPSAALATGESNETNIFVDESRAATNLIPSAQVEDWTTYVRHDPATVVAPGVFFPPSSFFTPPGPDGKIIRIKVVSYPCPASQDECGFERTGLTASESDQFFDGRANAPVFNDGFESGSVSAFKLGSLND